MIRFAVFSLAFLLGCTQAHADTEICQTVDGRTTCTHATGNVSCISINGETRCTPIDPHEVQPEQPKLPEISMPGVEVRREGGRLRVVAGGTEILLPQ